MQNKNLPTVKEHWIEIFELLLRVVEEKGKKATKAQKKKPTEK